MIKTKILDKRSICHALITSSYDPETMIPVKGVIEDVFFEENIPVYSIRIIKFYDGINFLKSTFVNKPFLTNYKGKPKPLKLPKDIHTVIDMENWLGEKSKYRFCVESNMTFRTKNEMMEFFHKIQEYLILQKLRFVKRILLRTPYQGPLSLNSIVEFDTRIKRAFSDLFPEQKDMDLFVEMIG
jgi:hypothetical protein